MRCWLVSCFLAAAETFEFVNYRTLKMGKNKNNVHAVHHKESKNFPESLIYHNARSAAAKNMLIFNAVCKCMRLSQTTRTFSFYSA